MIGRMTAPGTLTTSDGVTIAYHRTGTGPPLLLAHGGLVDHTCFDPIRAQLAERFTVTAYDRRGHGQSDDGDGSDGAGYALDREVADFVEVATHVGAGGPVAVIGYSYGATIALRAVTTRPAPVRALVAYEAPFDVPGIIPAADEIVALLADRRYDDAVRLFVATTFHLSANAVRAMANHPTWQVSLANAHTLARETAAVLGTRLTAPTTPAPPVRYLVADQGGNPAFRHIAAAVATTIPNADTATVPGLPHFAISTEPETFLARALEHLDRHPAAERPGRDFGGNPRNRAAAGEQIPPKT
jgi:pimeloyl-ACP methyl ester carboxylesterase